MAEIGSVRLLESGPRRFEALTLVEARRGCWYVVSLPGPQKYVE